LLVKYGFIKPSAKEIYADCSTPDERDRLIKSFSDEEVKKHADMEIAEQIKDQYMETGFPKPLKKYHLIWETYGLSIEEPYFWLLNYVRDWGFDKLDKTEDVFSASENSAFFGVNQQRIGLQQDKVSQFLATIGKMVKELFQIVRELRILDERIGYYEDSYRLDTNAESAEITLKGIWIDMVEGGAKNPASVYGMSRELQFTTLPDLFFKVHPEKKEDVDRSVDKLDFNRKVKEVLKRKLYSFIAWKEMTYKELYVRKKFTLKYLRQHVDIIKMYMEWVRPYLKHIKRLSLDENKLESPDLIAAFEGSMIEIEFLAHVFSVDRKTGAQNKEYKSCVIAHFLYRTRPSLSYQQEGYQRGPIHVGKFEVELRAYSWREKDIENYKKMKLQEDFELMKSIGGSVEAAMEALGEEFYKYLEEAGETKKEESKGRKLTLNEKIFGAKRPKSSKPKAKPRPKATDKIKTQKDKKAAEKYAKDSMWEFYKNFKKAHKMPQM